MSWTKTNRGYELEIDGDTAVLYKAGRHWCVDYRAHTEALGRRASFDEAESIITDIVAGDL